MDGSRRYSKVYCKTQSGAEALTSARRALSSSARQLLILLDGQRDFDELAAIFGEEALYRSLALLESQGYVEPLPEPDNAQVDAVPAPTVTSTGTPTITSTVTRTGTPTVTRTGTPTVTRTGTPTVSPNVTATTVPAGIPTAEPAVQTPVPTTARSSRRFTKPIAIATSLLSALGIITWVFQREGGEAQTPQDTAPHLTPAPNTGKRPNSVPNTSAQITESAPPTQQPSAAAPLPDSAHSPPHAASLSSATSRPTTADASAKTSEASSPNTLRPKTSGQSTPLPSKPPATDAAVSTTVASKPTPTRNVETPTTAEPSSPASAANHAQPQTTVPAAAVSTLHVRSRVLPAISKRALQSGIYAGNAVVRLHINSSGAVERVELVSATPPEVYGPDVEQALEQWTFEPPSNPAQFTLELNFRQQPPAAATTASKPAQTPEEAGGP